MFQQGAISDRRRILGVRGSSDAVPVGIEVDAKAEVLDWHDRASPLRVVRQVGWIEGDAHMCVVDREADADAVRFRLVRAYLGHLPHEDAAVAFHACKVENRRARHRVAGAAAALLAADLDDDRRVVEQMDVLVSATFCRSPKLTSGCSLLRCHSSGEIRPLRRRSNARRERSKDYWFHTKAHRSEAFCPRMFPRWSRTKSDTNTMYFRHPTDTGQGDC